MERSQPSAEGAHNPEPPALVGLLAPTDCQALFTAKPGKRIGRGNESEVFLSNHESYAIKVMSVGQEHHLLREYQRLQRLPALSTLTTFLSARENKVLMPRFHQVCADQLESDHIARMVADTRSAPTTLHTSGIARADVRLGNVMVRTYPSSFVRIDLAGCAGDSLYPLSMGYGALGRRGDKRRHPQENSPKPTRAAKGDYFRLAMMVKVEILKLKTSFTKSRNSLPRGLEAEPAGSWGNSCVNPVIFVRAYLWSRDGTAHAD